MKRLLTIGTLAALLAAPALAASHKEAPMTPAASAPAMTAQQSKMGMCNKDAGDKKGDDRKAFMKECLSAEKMSQQDKMKKCNADAKDMKGDERKAYMKTCLSA